MAADELRVLLRAGDTLRYLAKLQLSQRDGSIVLVFPRVGITTQVTRWSPTTADSAPDGGRDVTATSVSRTQKVTIHASGRINFERRREPIFIEPLARITNPSRIVLYRFPSPERLDPFAGEPGDRDLIWEDFNVPEGQPAAVEVVVAPSQYLPASAIQIRLGLGRLCSVVLAPTDAEGLVPPDLVGHFVTAYSAGTRADQAVCEDQALIDYHRAITGAPDAVLYSPNGEGWYRLIFPVPMRIPPQVVITAADHDLVAEIAARDTRASKVQLRFRFRHARSGAIARTPVPIESIDLDAEL